MRRVFFEKDPKFDYLFVIANPNDNSEIYKVKNFTDEMGHEYVYTLISERKKLTEENLAHQVNSSNGKFKNYNGGTELTSAVDYIESIIDNRSLNKEEDIFVYFREK